MDQFCTKCGTRLVNGSCPNCSGAQAMPQAQQSQTQYQPQEFVDDVDEIDSNDERLKSIFVSRKENFVCALGNWYLINYLEGGFLGRGFAVVSDKRVYFKGISYEIGTRTFKRRSQSSTVDLKDVTGTDVKMMRNIFLLIAGIACFILSLATLLIFIVPHADELNSTSGPALSTVCGIFLWGGIITLIIYSCSRKTFLSIYYAGGHISFPLNWYPAEEGEEFQKTLRIAKDKAVEEAENVTANAVLTAMSVSSPQPQSAVLSADELTKYAQLYKDGLITEQEFADIKARLLAKQ